MKNKKLIEELEQLDALEKRVRQSLDKAPDGNVRAEMSKGKYPQYYYVSKRALEKIDLYAENGIHIGERLFVTFESSMKPINLNRIDDMIQTISIVENN
ncbi:MAG: hypothetical protein MJZ11_03790 [Lachnospiraceae bacterium]|nr:hypothetical protein [Lachnospiraceae bacterium]